MKRWLLFLILIINCSITAQHERTNKNLLFTAEYGILNTTDKFLGNFSELSGNSFGLSIGKYIATKQTGILPISIRLQYNYQRMNLPVISTSSVNLTEHWVTFPIQFDMHLFSMLLNKSSKHECRSLNNGLSLAIYPGFGFVDGYDNINKKWPLPLEIGYSMNISKSGGHKSVASKDIHFYFFARIDLNPRYEPIGLPISKIHEHCFGLRIQYTHYKTYNFLNVN